jgi:CHAT domain-containing protein/tetratricopeptide (TPR) repeat protein
MRRVGGVSPWAFIVVAGLLWGGFTRLQRSGESVAVPRAQAQATTQAQTQAQTRAQTQGMPQAMPASADFTPRFAELGRQIRELTETARYVEALARADAYVAEAAPGSPAYASALSYRGLILEFQGQQPQAKALYEQAAALYRANNAGGDLLARALSNLGRSRQAESRTEEAEKLYNEALAIQEAVLPPGHADIATTLVNLSVALLSRSESAAAEGLMRRALAIREAAYPADDPRTAGTLQTLASAVEAQGRLTEAEALLRRAVAIRVTAQPGDHPEVGGAFQKLGVNLYLQRRHGEAETALLEGLRIRRLSASFAPEKAGNLADLARVYLFQQRLGDAGAVLGEAMSLLQATLPADHKLIADTNRDLAQLEELRSNPAKALDYSQAATRTYVSRQLRDETARYQFQTHVKLAWTVYAGAGPQPDGLVEEAFVAAQRANVTATSTSLTRMAARLGTRDPALQAAVRERQDTEAELAMADKQLIAVLSAPDTAGGRADAGPIRTRIAALGRRLAGADARLAREFPDYQALIRPQPLKVAEVQAALGADEALVYYLVTYDDAFVWAVTREAVVWRKLQLDSERIRTGVQGLRASIDARNLVEIAERGALFRLGDAHDLYRDLFGPVEEVTAGKRHLIIAASGALTSLPFQVLVTAPPAVRNPRLDQASAYFDAAWLVRKHAVSVLPAISSLTSLKGLAAVPPGAKSLIGFGNPVFDPKTAGRIEVASAPTTTATRGGPASARTLTRSGPAADFGTFWTRGAPDLQKLRSLAPLPNTETELRTVARLIGKADSRLMFGAAASEQAVKSEPLADYGIVYFATHALVAGEIASVGEPALVLTLPKVPTDADDGLLTSTEVAQLKLNAEWVILSACNTATEGQQGAEALSGLAQAFFYAGARALLVSHWAVNDAATADLMTRLFAELARNPQAGRAAALQTAMVGSLGDRRDPWNAYPAFWGAFFVVGSGGPQ